MEINTLEQMKEANKVKERAIVRRNASRKDARFGAKLRTSKMPRFDG